MAQDPSRKKRMNDMMLRYPKGKQVDPEVREKLKKLLDSKKPKTMRKKMMGGGSLKSVDPKTQKGLSKLPTKVRNKMGFMKKGGVVSDTKKKQFKANQAGSMKMVKKVLKNSPLNLKGAAEGYINLGKKIARKFRGDK